MQPTTQSTFVKHALASGLVSQADLDDALARLEIRNEVPADELSTNNAPDHGATDEKLADLLVEAGRLNRFQAAQLLAGHTKLNLGPYRIVDAIGQGGMGQVFRAEHSLLGRIVAVKVLPKSKSTPEAIVSFTREIRAQAALDHENLVRALDAGHDGNVYFLVCEYVQGADLRRYVRDRGPLGMAEAATIISQAARGLEHAHLCGLIHRDVKPANLLVTPAGHTKVSDLGLAGSLATAPGQPARDGADEDPRAGKVVGTADYLSPEHIISPLTIGATSDIYSLGCTLYYAVTGKVPYPGGNARDKARRHCEDTPLHPRLLNPSLSEPFVEVIAAMMEKDPAKRIASAVQVVERLKPWAGESVSSPRDPEDARRTRDGDFELDSGAGELTDTSASFEFELAVPRPPDPRGNKPPPPVPLRLAVATPSLLARPLVAMRPVPARPIVSVPPIRRMPLPVLAASPHSRSGRPWWAMPLVLVIAAATIVGVITAVALKMTGAF